MQPNSNGLPEGYDFLDTKPAPKRSLLPSGGGSQKQRMIIFLGGVLVFIIFGFVIFNYIQKATGPKTELLLTVLQDQQELVRVGTLGVEKSKGSEAKNFSASVQSSVQSDQLILLSLTQNNVKANEKKLALKYSAKTDTLLTNAEQTGRFDETVTEVLQALLKSYQIDIKNAYNGNDGKKTRAALDNAYGSSGLLLAPPKKEPVVESKPAELTPAQPVVTP